MSKSGFLFGVLFARVLCYFMDLKWDTNLENYPHESFSNSGSSLGPFCVRGALLVSGCKMGD